MQSHFNKYMKKTVLLNILNHLSIYIPNDIINIIKMIFFNIMINDDEILTCWGKNKLTIKDLLHL